MTDSELNELAATWNAARILYPIYSALTREFVIDLAPCPDLEAGLETPPRESVEQALQWLVEMDERIQVHQLRQFLQTTTLVSPELLIALLLHHLHKDDKSPSDRDKIDFLLVQFFSLAAPSRLEDDGVTLAYVAKHLEPVLGTVELEIPVWLQPLEGILQAARKARSLNQLLHSGILEQGRKLKLQSGENYFLPIALVAFARFSFLMRRAFFRLMHEDLNAIFDGLRELEQQGIVTIDCRRAQFSAEEPILRLRMICQSWKVMFQAEYSSGQPLRMLVDLRAAVDDALGRGSAANIPPSPSAKVAARKAAKPATKPAPAPAAKPAMAARAGATTSPKAAGSKFAVNEKVPEFEVSGGDPGWDPDGQSGN